MIGFIFAFQSLLGLASADTRCYYYRSIGSKIYQKYCSSGCCYRDSHDPCCPYYYNNYYTLSGTYIPYSLTSPATGGLVITNTQPPVSYSAASNTGSIQENTQPYGFHNSGFTMGTSGIGNTTRGPTPGNKYDVHLPQCNTAVHGQH